MRLVLKIVLFALEFLVYVENVLVQRLREQVVNLLCQVDLSHLQFREVVCHDSVLVIAINHLLQDGHVFARELTQAIVDGPSNSWVSHLLAVNDVLDEVVALIQILN